jgi:hypothetical protein
LKIKKKKKKKKKNEDDSFKSFFQVSKFYWNQAPKPSESSRTLINQRFIGFKPKSPEELQHTSFEYKEHSKNTMNAKKEERRTFKQAKA